LVQAFLKKWWVESDFKAPHFPLSLRLKGSGCHYNSIYNNTGTKLNLYSANSLKQQSADRQSASVGHILIPSQYLLFLLNAACLAEKQQIPIF
jgi:hypothetical protein